ncbi:hypothetical protein PHLCEN_2v6589 [Hermanssonia centrifuga]|uniref:Uncharacterized protein n=1 Tax=Hermanssonia centrifuga TaxID=98765 RepID=A0A2R6NZ04_9APHY|nr:hypothetical protein PHLCEN_2v6589 [Hermanssonia centrifuga]
MVKGPRGQGKYWKRKEGNPPSYVAAEKHNYASHVLLFRQSGLPARLSTLSAGNGALSRFQMRTSTKVRLNVDRV